MISYYTSKHPGLLTYITVISLSVPAFLFAKETPASLGIISILWGIYILMRCLSLYEVSELFPAHIQKRPSKNTNKDSSALAYDLVSRMDSNNHIKRGKYAMQSIQERTQLWLIIGLAYVAVSLYIEWKNTQILSINTISEISTSVFIIGSAFWAGQTYAYSQSASRILLGFLTILLAILLLYQPVPFTPHELTQIPLTPHMLSNDTAHIPLALLILYSTCIMLYACLKGTRQAAGAIASLCIIGVLCLYTLKIQDTPYIMALWLVGWSIVSIFWIRSFTQRQKSYMLYQCE